VGIFIKFITFVYALLTGMVCGTAISGPLCHPGANTTISVHNAFYSGKVQQPHQQLQTATTSNMCLQQQALMTSGEVSGSGNFVSVVPGVYSSPPPCTQEQQQQQPVSLSQPITTSADVLQVCMPLCDYYKFNVLGVRVFALDAGISEHQGS
jgi:hypothetical protein